MPGPKSVYDFFGINVLFHCSVMFCLFVCLVSNGAFSTFYDVFDLSPALHDIFLTPMARYSLCLPNMSLSTN